MARIRIGDLMVKAGLIDEMQLTSALSHQRKWGGRLGDVLVEQGFLDEMMLYKGLSKQLGIPLVSLPELDVTPELCRHLDAELAAKHSVFPVQASDRELVVATSQPDDLAAQDELSFQTGKPVRMVLAPLREITWAIGFYYQGIREPCPPPKERVHLPSLEGPPVTEEPSRPPSGGMAGPVGVPMASSPAIPAAGAGYGAPSGTLGQVRTELTGLSPGRPGPDPAALERLEQELRQTTRLLRLVVDHCVSRGLFTREQYLERVRALRSR